MYDLHQPMITKQNLLRHELVGMEAHVHYGSSSNPKIYYGMILHETKNCFILREKGKVKIIPKMSIRTLRVEIDDGVCFIKGSSLLGRPEDRVFR
jgi:RNase P/RNase MRP subunit p29